MRNAAEEEGLQNMGAGAEVSCAQQGRGEESKVVAFMVLLKSVFTSWCLILLDSSAVTPTIIA